MGGNEQPPVVPGQQLPIKTGNPWPALKTAAAEGKFKFEQEVAYNLANAASLIIGQIRTLQNQTTMVTTTVPFADMPSGIALTKKLSGKGDELKELLGKHIGILQDMIDTFIAAGKKFDAKERENEAMFDAIKPSKIGTALPGAPMPIATEKPPYSKDPKVHFQPPSENLKNSKGFEPSTIMVESAGSQSWEALYTLGESIKNYTTVQRAANWSGRWKWMAEMVQQVFSDFLNRIDSVTADQWEGPSKEMMVAAIKAYAASVPALQQSMNLIGDNLMLTSGWLDSTQLFMPTTPHNPGQQTYSMSGSGYGGYYYSGFSYTVPDQLQQHREWMAKTYAAGLPQSASQVPLLAHPDASFKDIPADPFNPTGQDPTKQTYPGGPGSGPTLSATNPGPSAADTRKAQERAEAQRKAQEKFEREQREAVRRQQEAAEKYQREQQEAGRQQQQESAAYQRQQQEAARKQQEEAAQRQQQQAVEQAAQQTQQAAQQAAQEAMSAGQQAAQEAMAAAQQAAQQAMAGVPGLAGLAPGAASALEAAKNAALSAGKPGGLGGAGAGAGAGAAPVAKELSQTAKLFPRAAAATAASAAGRMPGLASPMAGMPGSPGAAGAAGRGAGDSNQNHKRAAFLDSTEHMEEALGDAPQVVRPVVER
ncbi:hypothetical protein ACFQZZ_31330 [Nocardia sp. GCM10030253]|uniref:hypothetical protein n=1 Tax=Nocardia sp. GCM10030253 TaxID=3273404 RepID=UPI00363914BD